MPSNEITVRAEAVFDGPRGRKVLALNQIVSQFDLGGLNPEPGPIVEPWDLVQIEQRRERRRRFVDHVASSFALALTEAIYKAGR